MREWNFWILLGRRNVLFTEGPRRFNSLPAYIWALPSDGQPVERRVPACGDLHATFYIADSLTRWHGFRPQALGAGSSAISYARPCLCPAAARARRLTEQVSAEQHLLVRARTIGGRNLDRHGSLAMAIRTCGDVGRYFRLQLLPRVLLLIGEEAPLGGELRPAQALGAHVDLPPEVL